MHFLEKVFIYKEKSVWHFISKVLKLAKIIIITVFTKIGAYVVIFMVLPPFMKQQKMDNSLLRINPFYLIILTNFKLSRQLVVYF